MTNNTNHIDRLGRTISTPRDLSKTHKRVYIVNTHFIDPKAAGMTDEVTYVKNEWQAKGMEDCDKQTGNTTTYYPAMVTNETYDRIG